MEPVALTNVVPESMPSTVWSLLVREFQGFVEVFTLDPELILAGGVAGVGTDLEGDHDDGADGPGLVGGLSGGMGHA
jgi:hypothetical protein